jgi:hypothetical protein
VASPAERPGAVSGDPAATLAEVAAASGSGTAWLTGDAVGSLHFREGRVVAAELAAGPSAGALLIGSGRLTPTAWADYLRAWAEPADGPRPAFPPATGLSPLEWATITLEGLVDAAAELLPARPSGVAADLVFHPGQPPGWTRSGRSIALSELRREVARRQFVLDRLRPVVGPDTELVRTCPEWLGPVQVSAQQWRLLAVLGDRSTPRSVAPRIGAGVFATVLLVRTLIVLGMVAPYPEPDDSGRVGRFPPTLFSDAVAAAGG